METYSYLFHWTMISDNPGCLRSMWNFIWNNYKSPHSWHILPPTHLLMKNTFLEFLLHSIIEIKSHTPWGAGSPSQFFFQKYTNVLLYNWNSTWYRTKTNVSNCIWPNISRFQLTKNGKWDIDTKIWFFEFLEQRNSCHHYNMLSMLLINASSITLS